VLDLETLAPVPADGETLGEVMFRGNLVMKGYLKNAKATEEAFAGGWFHSGGLAALREIDPGTVFLAFGHMGDGNLHYVFCTPQKGLAMDRLLRMVASYGGSISAEHGIGVDKKAWLHMSRSKAEIATLRALKATLDPRGILDPGRIFDPL